MEWLSHKFRSCRFDCWALYALLVIWCSATFSPALMRIAFGFAIAFWLFELLKTRAFPASFQKDKLLWLSLALFYFWVILSSFTSEYPKESLRGIWKVSLPVLIFLMNASLFRTGESKKKFLLCFWITALLVIADSFYQYAFGKDFLRQFPAQDASSGIRLVGPFGDFGRMAAYLILVIPVFALQGWYSLRQASTRMRGGFYFLTGMALFALLYLTRCRAPVLALAISLFFLFIYKRWFRTLILALLLSGTALLFIPHSTFFHFNIQSKEQSIIERFCLWRRAWDVIRIKPLLGTGINTYAKAHAKYDTVQQKSLIPISGTHFHVRQNPEGSVSFISGKTIVTSDNNQSEVWLGEFHKLKYKIYRDSNGNYFVYNELLVRGYYAHNGYLQLAAEIGIPGIFFFLSFWVILFVKGLLKANLVRGSEEEFIQLGMMTGLCAFLLYALADTNLQSPQSLVSFWFLAGILFARQNADARGNVV